MSTRIKTLNPETTTGKSKELFDAVQKKLGFVPNLLKVLGNSPATLETYLTLGSLTEKGNFKHKVREQLALTIAETNNCDYCLSAHSKIGSGHGLTAEEINKNRKGTSEDAKIEALLQFTKKVTENKGVVSDADLKTFKDAGYTDEDVLEVVLNVVANTLTNYVNHIADTEIDFPVVEAGKFN
ncbi:carboxymuconolactone decarboxylase family protein [Joostella atrarenae]|uniref:Carboxymuconolactone decarboxylase family protein n=1 Tax=Joostella atrarenae TaxID=679257 RepID=A0ABS9J3S8_9FLAO|nr:carboxymuconolactone decarboxylase family protein [Joostella atrarenae]MCF8715081.1 carboxymuconolactone decarboxylase family protein [Joostella atrarenae]